MEAGLGHAAAPPLTAARRQMLWFGLGVFMLSEAGIFISLFAVRFVLAGSSTPAELNQGLAAALSVLVALSALPAVAALRAGARGDARRVATALGALLAIGVALGAGIAYEWATLALPAGSRFASAYFTALGIHAAHVGVALLLVAGTLTAAARGRLDLSRSFAVRGTVAFWLFVAVAWLGLYVVFYLL